jgi:vacuolar-type H+-ATPase subunit F/Vma7
VSRVAAIGEAARLQGYRLAGVEVHEACGSDQVGAAWRSLSSDVALVILSPAALAALGPAVDERPRMLWTALPA